MPRATLLKAQQSPGYVHLGLCFTRKKTTPVVGLCKAKRTGGGRPSEVATISSFLGSLSKYLNRSTVAFQKPSFYGLANCHRGTAARLSAHQQWHLLLSAPALGLSSAPEKGNSPAHSLGLCAPAWKQKQKLNTKPTQND